MSKATTKTTPADEKLQKLFANWRHEQKRQKKEENKNDSTSHARNNLVKNIEENKMNEYELESNKNEFLVWFLENFTNHSSESLSTTECSLEDFAVFFLNNVRRQIENTIRQFRPSETIVEKGITTVHNSSLSQQDSSITPRRHQMPDASRNDREDNSDGTMKTPSTAGRLATSAERISFSQASTPRTSQHQHSHNRRLYLHTPNHSPTPVANSSPIQHRSGGERCFADFIGNVMTTTPQRGSGHKKRNNSQQHQQQHHSLNDSSMSTTAAVMKLNNSSSGQKPKKRVVPTTIGRLSLSASSSANGMRDESTKKIGDHDGINSIDRLRNGCTSFGSNSSFCNDNNILNFITKEVDDDSQCSIREARQSLRMYAGEIAKEITTPTKKVSMMSGEKSIQNNEIDMPCESHEEVKNNPTPFEYKLELVTSRSTLDTLARIYDVLIELNLITNILSEISFLVNLLNASVTVASVHVADMSMQKIMMNDGLIQLLSHLPNAIYFAVRVLCLQRCTLIQLDAKGLDILLHSERLKMLAPKLTAELIELQRLKQQREREETNQRFIDSNGGDGTFRSVHYQAEHDARQNFPTQAAFGAYRTQRDLFYKALKTWQMNSLRSAWHFNAELGSCIDELLRQSEHPINMAHLARLFVSQLLIAASDATSPDNPDGDNSEILPEGLRALDGQKLNRLTQRLVAPSSLSADFQFPRQQVFFRDFIQRAATRSTAFAEQLKMTLYVQLHTLNESKYEQYNIQKIGSKEGIDIDDVNESEWAVRPDTLASLLILAKFLGFVIALPYTVGTSSELCGLEATTNNNNNGQQISSSLEQKQIALRRLFQPQFQLEVLLRKAYLNGRLLITIPWLVQYLAMLDNVSLQLDDCVATTRLLCCIYAQLHCSPNLSCKRVIINNETTKRNYNGEVPTVVFILRCCIGWLFEERPLLGQQYFSYRSMIVREPQSKQKIEDMKRTANKGITNKGEREPFSLQTLLSVSCPFLAEFRLSIMPAKWAVRKDVSRTGRYRYITLSSVTPQHNSSGDIPRNANNLSVNATVLKESSSTSTQSPPLLNEEQQQAKLRDAFLHSQPPSMRRLLEFVADRVYKSTIKDVQLQLLAPIKSAADGKVNEITSIDYQIILDAVEQIYEQAREHAIIAWDEQVMIMLDKRIVGSLEALLPMDTVEVIRKTYAQLIRRQTHERALQWRYLTIEKDNAYFSCSFGGGGGGKSDGIGQNAYLHEIARKISKSNVAKGAANSNGSNITGGKQSTELLLLKEQPSVSGLLMELQEWLHLTSEVMASSSSTSISVSTYASRLLNETNLLKFLSHLPDAFENKLPAVFYRLVGSGLVHLLQHLIIRHRHMLESGAVATAAVGIWLAHPMIEAHNENDNGNDGILKRPSCIIFDSLLTIGFITQCDAAGHQAFVDLTTVLVVLVKGGALTVNEVNNMFLRLFKESWSASVLNEISQLLKTVEESTIAVNVKERENNDGSTEENAKSHLLMEALADLVRDVDDY